MNKGINFNEFLREVGEREEKKEDYIVPANDLSFSVDGGKFFADLWRGDSYLAMPVKHHAHNQLAEMSGIPIRYYNRMKAEAPVLLADNLNHWNSENKDTKLVRTLDGELRAVLSNSFMPYDNYPAMQTIGRVFNSIGMSNLNVVSAQLTDSRMYLQVVDRRLEGEVRVGDYVQGGIVISNSEIGMGRLTISELIYRLSCLNGAIMTVPYKKTHIGRRQLELGQFKADTIRADINAEMLKLRDVVERALNDLNFKNNISKMQNAASDIIDIEESKPIITVVTKRYNLPEERIEDIFMGMVKENDFTRYGLSNAITYQAHNEKDYDLSVDYQRVGGEILELDSINPLRKAA